MQRLLDLLNTYPASRFNKYDFVFSKPVYLEHKKATKVNIKALDNSNGYIDKDIFYQRVNLNDLPKDHLKQITVEDETTLYQLLPKLNKALKFSYSAEVDDKAQDVIVEITEDDILDMDISTLPDNTNIIIDSKQDSYVFTGSFSITLLKPVKQLKSIDSLSFGYVIRNRSK